MSEKIDAGVCEWAESRLIIPPGIPTAGWFGIRVFYNDYVRTTTGRAKVLPINLFSIHVRAIPSLDVKRTGNGSVLVGAVYDTLMPFISEKFPQIGHIHRGLRVTMPRRAKRISGTRSEIYIYRGALKAAADAADGDIAAALKKIADDADEQTMRAIGRAIAKTIKKAKGLDT